MMSSLNLKWGFSFEDLYRQDGLARLDAVFLQNLPSADRLRDARSNFSTLSPKQKSDLIVDLAPHVEDFIGELFGISAELRALQARHDKLAPLFALKRKFVHQKAISGVTK